MEKKFKIDFFELSFLASACIPLKPIARTMFWLDLINIHYHELTESERARMYEWMNREPAMETGIEDKVEDCLLFNARFNPENQYVVTTKYKGEVSEHECFLWKEGYYTTKTQFIAEEYITIIKNKKDLPVK